LADLVEQVMVRPLVLVGIVARAFDVTLMRAGRTVGELGLREITGRGGFRACGVA